jgi:acylphosphatase
MRTDTLLHRTLCIATSLASVSVVVIPAAAKSGAKDKNITAVSGRVTGNVQQVGFRAMIQKQAIRYNLAGSAENNSDLSVRFLLQGDDDRIKQALKTITKGTKKSSNVSVSRASVAVTSNLMTFTVIGWTSVSRGITQPYDLIFHLRIPDTVTKKDDVKSVWLMICENAVKGEDVGKCDKGNDD